MDNAQRAVIAAKIADHLTGRPKANTECPLSTIEDAAAKVNVSRSYAAKASAILKKAPELAQAVLDGKLGIAVASKLKDAPPDERAAVVERLKGGKNVADAIKGTCAEPNNSGKPFYTEKGIVKAFDELCRQVDGRAKVHGSCKEHLKMVEALNSFFGEYREWLKAT
jgi:hypothetical protein